MAGVAIYLASAVAIPLGQSWFARRGVRAFEFPILILLASLGMGMMVGSGDLISLYMGVELQSFEDRRRYVDRAREQRCSCNAVDAE